MLSFARHLLPVLRHRATWGVSIAIGVALAVWANGFVKYRAGHRDGAAAEQVNQRNATDIAQQVADSAWSVLYRESVALRDSMQVATAAAARAGERSARAEGRLEAAQARYASLRVLDTDSTPSPMASACDELASACEAAKVASTLHADSLKKVIRLAERKATTQDITIATEPVRTRAQIAKGITVWRDAHPQPSRIPAFVAGVGTGLSVAAALIFGLR